MSKESKNIIVKAEHCTTGWLHFLTQKDIDETNSPEQIKLNEELKAIRERHGFNKRNNKS